MAIVILTASIERPTQFRHRDEGSSSLDYAHCSCGWNGPRRTNNVEKAQDILLHFKNDGDAIAKGEYYTTLTCARVPRGEPPSVSKAFWIGLRAMPTNVVKVSAEEQGLALCENMERGQVCGMPIENEDIGDLAQLRFGVRMCSHHWQQARRGRNTMPAAPRNTP